jgi:Ferroportin1 (FPN1)
MFSNGYNGHYHHGKYIIDLLFSQHPSHCAFYTSQSSVSEVSTFLSKAKIGPMIAFLSQYSDFSTPLIAGLRAIAVIVGITATFLSPPLIRLIGPIRSGIWFLSWQTIFLSPVIIALFLPMGKRLQGGLLVGFVSISRLGLWGFDLSEQYLVQEVTPFLRSGSKRRKLMLLLEGSFRLLKRHCNRCLMYYSIRLQLFLRDQICSSIQC